MNGDDAFGFGSVRPKLATAEKLRQIKPQPDPSKDVPSLAKVDQIAEGAGFTSREPTTTADLTTTTHVRATRRKKEMGPFVMINTRTPVRVAEPFQAFCDNNRYSYWEGIEELMKKAGLL